MTVVRELFIFPAVEIGDDPLAASIQAFVSQVDATEFRSDCFGHDLALC
jgi:hypothetical protein